MASILEDGSVLPSFLGVNTVEERGEVIAQQQFDNTSLKTGYVVGIHYPKDQGYADLTEIVYDVVCPTSFQGGGTWWQHFRNVKWGSGIGGSPKDFTEVRLYCPIGAWKPNSPITQDIIDQSTAVNLLCENGQSHNGVIVGFAKHLSRQILNAKDLGHYYRWDFNGMSSIIDKDGQYKVTFTGAVLDPQTNKYKDAPAETTGTYFQFSKEGNWLVDNSKGESILLDKKNKALNIRAREMRVDISEKDYSTTVKGKMVFKSDGVAVLNGKKNYIGKEGATEPLVLGKKLTTALQKLIAVLITPPIGVLGSAPVMPSPALIAGLNQWMAQYATPTSPFLSRKGFVE
jgi:hypothetical protein